MPSLNVTLADLKNFSGFKSPEELRCIFEIPVIPFQSKEYNYIFIVFVEIMCTNLIILYLIIVFVNANHVNDFIIDYFNLKNAPSVVVYSCNDVLGDGFG